MHTSLGSLPRANWCRLYLDRIEAYDKAGPAINAIITLNTKALEEADRIDATFKAAGYVGPLHGIAVVVKDQADAAGMPTPLGSVLFKHYYPDRDSFVVDSLRRASAIVLGKTTLGELGGGDTHGSLFGSTRNPYDLERTVGGSSGGSAACVATNFATVGVAQEGLASIRRPATWNCIVGMRTTAGLVSRGGVSGGWPSVAGSLGPMARTVADLAKLLDVMVGYDLEESPYRKGCWSCPGQLHALPRQERLKGSASRHLTRTDGLPCGARLGRLQGYRIVCAYEQATHHRRPPASTKLTLIADRRVREDTSVKNRPLPRVLVMLFLVGGVVVHLRAQTSPQSELTSGGDAALRQQITHIYPTQLSEAPQPWFNSLDAVKIALGEALFFDPNLSRCGTLACASCHRPAHGFASPYQVPPGCDGVRGRRRAPTLYNVAYQGHYFWDGRVQSLEQQALLPVVTPAELGNVWDVVLTYLTTGRHLPTDKEYPQARAFYAAYFAEVFNGDITGHGVARPGGLRAHHPDA